MSDSIEKEALSFDKQILERIKHGHIPDLRSEDRNEWFYNSIWRDPFYVDMFFGEIFRKINYSIGSYLERKEIKILEACCGPGHMSLELARKGYEVTGVDVSGECIKIAKELAEKDENIKDKNKIRYVCGDIYDFEASETYDLIIFCNSLHHFGDLDRLFKKIDSLLNRDGIIFVADPTKNDLTLTDAVIIYTIRTLLSLGDIYFEDIPLPENNQDFMKEIIKIKQEFSYKDEEHKNLQSPFDGSSNFEKMYKNLKLFFTELEVSHDLAFFDKIIGGLRTGSSEKDRKVAAWLRNIDKILLDNKVISSKQFTFIGKKI